MNEVDELMAEGVESLVGRLVASRMNAERFEEERDDLRAENQQLCKWSVAWKKTAKHWRNQGRDTYWRDAAIRADRERSKLRAENQRLLAENKQLELMTAALQNEYDDVYYSYSRALKGRNETRAENQRLAAELATAPKGDESLYSSPVTKAMDSIPVSSVRCPNCGAIPSGGADDPMYCGECGWFEFVGVPGKRAKVIRQGVESET